MTKFAMFAQKLGKVAIQMATVSGMTLEQFEGQSVGRENTLATRAIADARAYILARRRRENEAAAKKAAAAAKEARKAEARKARLTARAKDVAGEIIAGRIDAVRKQISALEAEVRDADNIAEMMGEHKFAPIFGGLVSRLKGLLRAWKSNLRGEVNGSAALFDRIVERLVNKWTNRVHKTGIDRPDRLVYSVEFKGNNA